MPDGLDGSRRSNTEKATAERSGGGGGKNGGWASVETGKEETMMNWMEFLSDFLGILLRLTR